jgi:ribose transport system permease protein
VLITAAVDLSVGAIAVLAGLAIVHLTDSGMPGALAVLLTILGGAVVGCLANGVFIGYLRLNFFIVTLASLSVLTGIANLWTGGQSDFVHSAFVSAVGTKEFFSTPAPIWIVVFLTLLVGGLLRFTYFGRDIYAVGGSFQAAQLSGIRARLTLLIVYGISAALAALAGVIQLGQIGIAVPTVDPNLPLEAVAAVMLGGASLAGGSGGIVGTVVGVLFIGTLANGLSISGVPSFWQQVVTGVILLTAVVGRRRRGST